MFSFYYLVLNNTYLASKMLCWIPSAFRVFQPPLIAFNSIWGDYMHSKFTWVVTFYSISIMFLALARLCLTPYTPHGVCIALCTNSLLASFFHYSFIHYFYFIHMCSFTFHQFITPILFTCVSLPSIYLLLLFYLYVVFYLPFIHYFLFYLMCSFTLYLFIAFCLFTVFIEFSINTRERMAATTTATTPTASTSEGDADAPPLSPLFSEENFECITEIVTGS